MKKLLLSISFAVLGVMSAQAQSCTPGANFGDSTYGVWCDCYETIVAPDTITNFPDGSVGVFYSEDMNFKVPAQVTADIDPTFAGAPINYFDVTGVGGLPAGLDYACNDAACHYLGGDNGCANIYGTPTTAGVYPVTIEVTGNISIELVPGSGIMIDVDQDIVFDGYQITINDDASLFELIAPNFIVYPNPAIDAVTLSGLDGVEIESVNIVNLSGATVASHENINNTDVNIDIRDLEEGIYFLQVHHNDGYEAVKFIKE
ncbi:MAG: T9SS type A sorting domain-containing protein [Crocinitomicaceae bacterium]|nr:T9SS type A sorting domain-containing protein [Crocinitomicaceae bacterium]